MLDAMQDIRKLDSRGLLETTSRMAAHLRDGFRIGADAAGPDSKVDRVVLCGLGGSAISGDLARAWLSEGSSVPCEVARSYSVPAYVGPSTLVIAVSYSGDTEETLSMTRDAIEKGARTAVVSSGGGLEALAADEGKVFCGVPPGLVPRAATGHLFGVVMGLLDGAGVAVSRAELEEAAGALEQVRSACGPDVETPDNPAKRLAHELHGTIPVVVGHGVATPVARRWADQLNENAKMIAFGDELPEMNHNGIVGWMSDSLSQGFSMVFLELDGEGGRMPRRTVPPSRNPRYRQKARSRYRREQVRRRLRLRIAQKRELLAISS